MSTQAPDVTIPSPVDPRFGAVSEGVTHWSLLRVVGDQTSRVGHPDADGVVVQRWPLADLSVETVRARWGRGTYRVQWYTCGVEGNRTRGMSPPFELSAVDDAEPGQIATPADPASQFLAIQRSADARASAEFDRVLGLVERLRGAVATAPSAPPAPAAELAELARLREENQELRLRAAVREESERAAAPLRAELAERDRRLAELERERGREDDGPTFEPGQPIVETIVAAAMTAALRNPEIVGAVLGPLVDRFANANKPAAPAPPPPAPAPAPPVMVAAPRPVVVPFARPAPAPAPEPAASLYGSPQPIAPASAPLSEPSASSAE